MYEVTVDTVISASHHLRGYQGKCERVHGHNWKIEATAAAADLDPTGLAIDFGLLRKRLVAAAADLDHADLNEVADFRECNPSSENLARVIYRRLQHSLAGERARVVRVRVWETEGSVATYHE
ncbi:MAG TPA: 6-carboxytetrahydropterin synthase [Myxococcota bacterium]|nr:6-carboxytetrahydropterin synthase [Myxococcota bacterium]HRY92391.1 6-carboxytetrahydropterin synthase [Myxococcota bacterium]